jgi:hypothetical protein
VSVRWVVLVTDFVVDPHATEQPVARAGLVLPATVTVAATAVTASAVAVLFMAFLPLCVKGFDAHLPGSVVTP